MSGDPRILVVDQDFESRAELQKGLVRSRFIVVGGVDYGAEALSLASELRPQIVLIGVEEPAERALQTIASLSDLLPESPIIAYSGRTDAESARQAVVAGARDYLVRPLKVEDVIKAIEMALAQQERRKGLLAGETPSDLRTGGMIIAVFGAKGGIGKTTIATNLAAALIGVNAGSAVLVDVDTIFGDVGMMMNLPAEETSLIDVAANIDELDRESIGKQLVQHSSGVRVLPAPFDPTDWRDINPEAADKVLTLLAQTHDFVIVDCPPTFTDLVAVVLGKATVVLLVTTLDITSIKGTATAMKLLRNGTNGDRIKLMVNHVAGVNAAKEKDVSKIVRQEVFWSIPHDGQMSTSVQLGTPVVIERPSSQVSKSIVDLATQLAGLEPAPESGNGRSRSKNAPNGILRKLFMR